MSTIRTCEYINCYYNDNLEHACLNEKVTVSATGVCENLLHCDDYECPDCERFDVCTKEKKRQYLSEKE
ncbi:hypothetical protein ACFL6I_00280 [candidate division KSB1 bacterium]